MRTAGSMAICLACLLLNACAGLDVGPVADDSKDRGYRYYEQVPFLFVRSDGKGGLTSEIVYQNSPRLMSARPYAYLATNSTNLSFTNGALNEAAITGDETVIPVGFVDALTKVASAAMAAADVPQTTESHVPLPHLFEIDVSNEKTITLVAVDLIDTSGNPVVIKTTIVPPAPKGN